MLAGADGRMARAGTSACTVTAAGLHTRDQLLTARLSAGCPATGTAGGTLAFAQYPGIRGQSSFTLDYAQRTLTVHLPATLTITPAWTAHSVTPALEVSVTATPRRHVFGGGAVTITGGFTATNHAVVTWSQSVTATPNRVTIGSFHVHARFPAGRRMVIQVHQDRSFCATGRVCPFGEGVNTETYSFPPSYTSASITSGLSFATGKGTMLWGRELPVILLRDAATGRILGRSDLLAIVRVPT